MRSRLAALLVLVPLVALAEEKKYRNELLGFAIALPEGMSVTSEPEEDDLDDPRVVVYIAPTTSTGEFVANVNVLVEEWEGDLDGWWRLNEAQIKAAPNVKLVGEAARKKVSGKDAVEYELTLASGERTTRCLGLAVVDSGRALVTTATMLPDEPEAKVKALRAALASFEVIPRKGPAAKPVTLESEAFGWRITVPPRWRKTLEAREPVALVDGATQKLAILVGPPRGEVPVGVNVIVQGWSRSTREFWEMSRSGIEQRKLELRSEARKTVSGRDAILYELAGTAAGAAQRFLGLAVLDPDQGRVFIVTCSAGEKEYPGVEKTFGAILESFALDAKKK